MTDRLGYRLRVGVLVPAFNSSLQPELDSLRPAGVTNHVARIDVADGPLTSDREQAGLVARVGPAVPAALRQVMAVKPAIVIHGISVPTFWNGSGGARSMAAELEAAAGVPVILGSLALEQVLAGFPGATRLGIVTPYQPVADSAVERYFAGLGYDVTMVHSLRRPAHEAISHATADEIVEAFKTVHRAGIDIIVQVGTNLAAIDLAAESERLLGCPVIAINAALYWAGLRRAGLDDPLQGCGRFFAEH
jgi:maleate isomerase